MESGVHMNPEEIPPIELLDDLLIPVKFLIQKIYWNGFRDGASIVGLIFFITFILTNKGVKG